VRDQIESRLRNTTAAENPVAAALTGLSRDVVRALFPEPLIPAAVLVPLVQHHDRLTILLTRRTDHLVDHPGQISFPGGRVEPGDKDAADTALREASEEIGLIRAHIDVAGYLRPHPVVTGFAVTPVVGFLGADLPLTLDPFEVAEAFEVPLDFFLDPENRTETSRTVRGLTLPMVEYQFGDYRIWGATAQILDTLITIIKT
jgi:8-oxo-dGTP pyrophosphatase MutT (NUDIX family)